MLRLRLYIRGAAFIAPELAPGAGLVKLAATEPDYGAIIPPMQLRRMSKAVRMGISASKSCLEDAGIAQPDSIIVGTGLGCLQDTEVFLKKMIEQEERMLTPTAFIQSTHNTMAGHIALTLGCRGFNTTISQRGHSFESAVINAALHLAEHPEENVLCGGVDELTDTAFHLLQRGGYYSGEAGAGEGAGFLLLSNNAHNARCCITGLHFFTEKHVETAAQKLFKILEEARQDQDVLYLDARDNLRQLLFPFWKGEILQHDATAGEWETSIAVTIACLARQWPVSNSCIWLLRDAGCGDYAVWRMERL